MATEAVQRWARIYRAEAAFAAMDHDSRRRARQQLSKPLWDEFEVWLKLQRTQVLDGSKIAEAIDYSLNAWKALTSAEKAARKLSSVPARAKIEEMLASLEQRLQGMSADRTQRVQRRRSKASRRRPER